MIQPMLDENDDCVRDARDRIYESEIMSSRFQLLLWRAAEKGLLARCLEEAFAAIPLCQARPALQAIRRIEQALRPSEQRDEQ